jgi:hypothetical protein
LDKFIRGEAGGEISSSYPSHFRLLNMIQNSSDANTPEQNMVVMDRAIEGLSKLVSSMDANNQSINDPITRKYLYADPEFMSEEEKSKIVGKPAVDRMMMLFDTFRYGPDTPGIPVETERNVIDAATLVKYTDFVQVKDIADGNRRHDQVGTRTFVHELATVKNEAIAENPIYVNSQEKLRQNVMKVYNDQLNRVQQKNIDQQTAKENADFAPKAQAIESSTPATIESNFSKAFGSELAAYQTKFDQQFDGTSSEVLTKIDAKGNLVHQEIVSKPMMRDFGE